MLSISLVYVVLMSSLFASSTLGHKMSPWGKGGLLPPFFQLCFFLVWSLFALLSNYCDHAPIASSKLFLSLILFFKERMFLDWSSLHPFSTLLMFESLTSITVLFSSRTSKRLDKLILSLFLFANFFSQIHIGPAQTRPNRLTVLCEIRLSPWIRVAKNVKTLKNWPFCGLKCVLGAIFQPGLHVGMWNLPKTGFGQFGPSEYCLQSTTPYMESPPCARFPHPNEGNIVQQCASIHQAWLTITQSLGNLPSTQNKMHSQYSLQAIASFEKAQFVTKAMFYEFSNSFKKWWFWQLRLQLKNQLIGNNCLAWSPSY